MANNKPNVTEEKIPINDSNLHKKLFSLCFESGDLVREELNVGDGYVWAGGITAHCYVKFDVTKTQIVGSTFTSIPFTAQLPEEIASWVLNQIRKDMKDSYGKPDKGIKL